MLCAVGIVTFGISIFAQVGEDVSYDVVRHLEFSVLVCSRSENCRIWIKIHLTAFQPYGREDVDGDRRAHLCVTDEKSCGFFSNLFAFFVRTARVEVNAIAAVASQPAV